VALVHPQAQMQLQQLGYLLYLEIYLQQAVEVALVTPVLVALEALVEVALLLAL